MSSRFLSVAVLYRMTIARKRLHGSGRKKLGKPRAGETSPELGRGFVSSVPSHSTHTTCPSYSPLRTELFFFLMVVSAKSQKQKRMFLLSKINVCVSSLQRLLPYLQQPWVERGNERWLLAEVTACSGHVRVLRHDAETFPDPN